MLVLSGRDAELAHRRPLPSLAGWRGGRATPLLRPRRPSGSIEGDAEPAAGTAPLQWTTAMEHYATVAVQLDELPEGTQSEEAAS